tara:strand:+ start:688 stop:858 length:171 start_codon:yes stop_codon:yes gene_type:complete
MKEVIREGRYVINVTGKDLEGDINEQRNGYRYLYDVRCYSKFKEYKELWSRSLCKR